MSHRGLAGCLLTAVAAVALVGCGSSSTAPVADDPGTTASAPTSSAAPSPSTTSDSGSVAPNTLITLDAPADLATVSGSFKVSGTANSPEANVPWQILDADHAKVLDGAFTADGWMDKLYPYSGSVDVSSLAPGSYTFVVSVDDESDGEGGAPQQVSRAITVS